MVSRSKKELSKCNGVRTNDHHSKVRAMFRDNFVTLIAIMSGTSSDHPDTSYLVREVGNADTTDADGGHVDRCRGMGYSKSLNFELEFETASARIT